LIGELKSRDSLKPIELLHFSVAETFNKIAKD